MKQNIKASIVGLVLIIIATAFGCKSKDSFGSASTSTIKTPSNISTYSSEASNVYYKIPNYEYFMVDNDICIDNYLGNEIHVNIPSKINGHDVKIIGTDSFYQKTNMKSVTIPKSVTEIEGGAFYRCHALQKAYIHDNIEKIDGNPYFRCSTLKEITVDQNNKYFCDIDGVLFNKDKTVLIAYPEGKKLDTYKIPFGVERIEESAFGYWPETTKVYIPKTVEQFPSNRLSAHYTFDLTLIVEKDSPALKYAVKNNLKYEIKK